MRIASFADGFTSSSAPTIEGAEQEIYTINNNVSTLTDITGLIFNEGDTRSVFGQIEIERTTSIDEYRQSISFIALNWTGAWELQFGNYIGDDMVKSSITSATDIVLSMTNAGQWQYQTGNMAGTDYVGKIKISLTRMTA